MSICPYMVPVLGGGHYDQTIKNQIREILPDSAFSLCTDLRLVEKILHQQTYLYANGLEHIHIISQTTALILNSTEPEPN